MININLTIKNPFSTQEFKNLFCKSNLISKNKAWEIESYRSTALFECAFNLNFKCDHAGLLLSIGLFGFTVSGSVYDTRHWDYEKNCWETHTDV